MTIMSPEATKANPAPRADFSGIGLLERNTRAYLTNTNRHEASPEYYKNPRKYRPDGTKADAIPDNCDPTYGETTTAEELAKSVDAQLLGANGTGAATIAQAPRFTRRRRAAGAPKMTISQVMDLKPFRVYRALAELMDEGQIHSPYTQLLDLVLTAKDRTDTVAARAAAADAAFPTEQMSLEYRSKAEEIIEHLDRALVRLPEEREAILPDVLYVAAADETPADHTPATPADPTPEGDLVESLDDPEVDAIVDSALFWSAPATDLGTWKELHLQDRAGRYMATTDVYRDIDDVDDLWGEFDAVEPLLYA